MNYLRAVQGPVTRAGKICTIQSAAEVEIQRKLSQTEFDKLLQRFSLFELYENTKKVVIVPNFCL